MVAKWIAKKMGIKQPAQHMREEYERTGRAVSEGFAEGFKKAQDRKNAEYKPDITHQANLISNATGIDPQAILDAVDQIGITLQTGPGPSIEMIRKGVDKTDMSTMSRDNHTIIYPLLKEVNQVVWDQQDKVLASGKYDHPVHKLNHNALEWMDHQMSEFADALVYHQATKQTIMDVVDLIQLAQTFNREDRMDKADIVNAILSDALDRLKGGK